MRGQVGHGLKLQRGFDFPLPLEPEKKKLMRVLAQMRCVIAVLAAVVLAVSVADARPVNSKRFGGANASLPSPRADGSSIPYYAGGSAYPTGHGSRNSSPDFQLQG